MKGLLVSSNIWDDILFKLHLKFFPHECQCHTLESFYRSSYTSQIFSLHIQWGKNGKRVGSEKKICQAFSKRTCIINENFVLDEKKRLIFFFLVRLQGLTMKEEFPDLFLLFFLGSITIFYRDSTRHQKWNTNKQIKKIITE